MIKVLLGTTFLGMVLAGVRAVLCYQDRQALEERISVMNERMELVKLQRKLQVPPEVLYYHGHHSKEVLDTRLKVFKKFEVGRFLPYANVKFPESYTFKVPPEESTHFLDTELLLSVYNYSYERWGGNPAVGSVRFAGPANQSRKGHGWLAERSPGSV